jgi:hypothetical protein
MVNGVLAFRLEVMENGWSAERAGTLTATSKIVSRVKGMGLNLLGNFIFSPCRRNDYERSWSGEKIFHGRRAVKDPWMGAAAMKKYPPAAQEE